MQITQPNLNAIFNAFDLRFQLGNGARDRRLRNIQALGRGGNVACVRGRDQITQLPQGQIH
jgi:hypothetical protein